MERKKKLFCSNFYFEKKLYVNIISFMTLISQEKCDILV